MGILFGKAKKNKNVNDKERAILDLKIARDKLGMYQKKVR